jgi:hypothetical protein
LWRPQFTIMESRSNEWNSFMPSKPDSALAAGFDNTPISKKHPSECAGSPDS